MADKFIKSITFVEGGDAYYPLPKVTNADDGKVLKVVDGKWSVMDPTPTTYLSFIGTKDFGFKTTYGYKNWDGTLEYSTDTITWRTWDGTEISSVGNKLYLRGIGNTKITGEPENFSLYGFSFVVDNPYEPIISCEGNIENLLDYETVLAGGHPTMADYCYAGLFLSCIPLATAPELPATTLTTGCYAYMFEGCMLLQTAPALPATTLATACYASMFYGCMFLETAPALPATTLANYCYYYMFEGCEALTTAPALPATTLAISCYDNMFYNCSALTTAPELPATTLADNCYDSMFKDCAKIKLSATQTGEYQTAYRIPKTGTGTTATDALKDMFANTGGTFTGTPEINTTYYTSNTVLIPPIQYLSFIGNEDFTLKTANTTKNWDGILEYSTDTTTWNTWDGTEISSAGSKLYLRGTGNTKITGSDLPKYSFVFTGTSALKIACKGNIENLLDYETVSAGGHPTMAALCYGFMFYNCTSLTTVPELPATTLANFCYYGMFYGCTSLTTVPELQATTLANNCYYGMFYGCTSLTTVPELPATTLANNCYTGMFKDCTNIKLSTTQTGEYQTPYRIPKSGTGTTATSALDSMFTNTGGTFTDTPNINTTYYLSTSNTVV